MDLPRTPMPPMARVRQRFPTDHVADVRDAVRQALRQADWRTRLQPGARVAVTAGSRGIANIVEVLQEVVAALRDAGARPFIVPAMGSHGGATVEGQRAVLASYGVTEESVGAPIMATMDTVELGRVATGATVHLDRYAAEADGIVVVGRVKAHTAFRGAIESGLCKMLAVGLGKQRGAANMHAHGLKESVPQAAVRILERAPVLLGVAIVENAYHQIHTVEAVPPTAFLDADRRLLELANRLAPRIPFDPLDLLVVGWMGKDISGSGMDLNVIGMWRRIGGEQRPYFARVAVLDLTEASEGNGIGIGMADFTTRRLFEKLDLRKTYMNVLTANAPQVGKIPIVLENDREAVEVALRSSAPAGSPRVVAVRSTLHLEDLWVSEALVPEITGQPGLEVLEPPRPVAYDERGNLTWW
ncbi:MAG TPA: lactate racemase domain-containing protein [Chloroflexota bacterium]